MICNVLIVISSVVTAFATAGLFFVGFSNLRLAKSIRDRSDQHEQEVKKLLRALVLAIMNAPIGGETRQSAFKRFEQDYKEKTQIFD